MIPNDSDWLGKIYIDRSADVTVFCNDLTSDVVTEANRCEDSCEVGMVMHKA